MKTLQPPAMSLAESGSASRTYATVVTSCFDSEDRKSDRGFTLTSSSLSPSVGLITDLHMVSWGSSAVRGV